MKRIVLLWGIFLLGISFLACAIKSTPTERPISAISPVQEPQAAQKEPWEVEWERLLSDARKEARLTIYTILLPDSRTQLHKVFKEKFGIEIEMLAGRAPEVVAKIVAERRAGIFIPDLYISGPTTALALLKPIGALESMEKSLILPAVLDKKSWWGGKGILWIDKNHTFIQFFASPSGSVLINTDLVKPGEITSYKDFLNPKWKGKIVLNDPSLGHSGAQQLSILARIPTVGWDYVEALAKQEPVLMADERLIVEWVARGRYPVAIGGGARAIMEEFRKAGMPIDDIYMKEGGHLSQSRGAIALLNQSPHPKAAQLFLNWILTREGQTLISRTELTQSAREDVPTDHLDSKQIRQSGVDYFNTAFEEWRLIMYEDRETFKRIFAPRSR